jgi:hypothetical protein
MAKIRSTKKALINSRDNHNAIVQIEISEWNFDVNGNRYIATVVDYAITINNEVESKSFINSKPMHFDKSQIDGLFTALGNPILTTESYTEQMKNVLAMALLIETQTRPIYQLTAQDFEIYIEPIVEQQTNPMFPNL